MLLFGFFLIFKTMISKMLIIDVEDFTEISRGGGVEIERHFPN